MSTRTEMETALDDYIDAWTGVPCHLIRDNTPSRSDDYSEWMRLVVFDGDSFVQQSAGLMDVRGSTDANPFILSFDIFTPKNAGTLRQAEIFQNIKDYWAYRPLGDIKFDTATFSRVGEEGHTFHTNVIVNAVRYETLDARR